eukprot:TRINITY_DN1299_c2_g1_i1.p1 TRINITY_DN1299_c2_g1~~TRINITY_DN1299_c2_g1_i1.p1  ORF type:complete len:386 (-),score=177.22 TRINITY_DN1299_c2_g1_i1:127-1284(-)
MENNTASLLNKEELIAVKIKELLDFPTFPKASFQVEVTFGDKASTTIPRKGSTLEYNQDFVFDVAAHPRDGEDTIFLIRILLVADTKQVFGDFNISLNKVRDINFVQEAQDDLYLTDNINVAKDFAAHASETPKIKYLAGCIGDRTEVRQFPDLSDEILDEMPEDEIYELACAVALESVATIKRMNKTTEEDKNIAKDIFNEFNVQKEILQRIDKKIENIAEKRIEATAMLNKMDGNCFLCCFFSCIKDARAETKVEEELDERRKDQTAFDEANYELYNGIEARQKHQEDRNIAKATEAEQSEFVRAGDIPLVKDPKLRYRQLQSQIKELLDDLHENVLDLKDLAIDMQNALLGDVRQERIQTKLAAENDGVAAVIDLTHSKMNA